MDAPARATEPGRSNAVLTGLMGQIARKNEGALAELYDRTSPVVYGLALHMAREQSVAEDITEDVYVHVWRRAAAFEPARRRVLNWLVMLTRARALDRLGSSGGPRGDSEGTETFRRPNADCGSSESKRVQFIGRLFSQLPRDQRRVIGLALFRGLTHDEIVRRTGLAHDAVKSGIRSGMIQLRE